MRILSFILVCFFGIFTPKSFQVIEATTQKVAGGRAESGISVNYNVTLKANQSSENLFIQGVWVDSVYYKAEAYKQNPNLSFTKEFEKGDTLFLRFSKKISSSTPIPIKKAPPIEVNGEALIVYKLKNKIRYKAIEDFKKLPMEYYP